MEDLEGADIDGGFGVIFQVAEYRGGNFGPFGSAHRQNQRGIQRGRDELR